MTDLSESSQDDIPRKTTSLSISSLLHADANFPLQSFASFPIIAAASPAVGHAVDHNISPELRKEVAPNKEDLRIENMAVALANVQQRIQSLAGDFKAARYWIAVGAIALAIAIYFHH